MAVVKFPGGNRDQTFEYDADYDGYEEEDTDDFIDDGDDALNEMTGEEAASYHKTRRRKALAMVARVLVGALLVGALGLLIYYEARTGTYSSASYTVIKESESVSGTQYLMLGNRIISYSRDGVSSMDMSGTQVYNITFEMQQPLAARSGDVLALADYGGSQIIILSPTAELGSVNTSLPIRQIGVAENGEVAAIVDDQSTTWIYIYDKGGNTIAYFKTTMAQSGYPVATAISPDGTLVAVSHLLASDDGVDSSIAFYNFGGVGANSVENNVSGFNFGNEIFPYVSYMNNSTCVAVSDTRAAFYTGSEIPQSGMNILFSNQAIGVWSNDKYLAVLFQDATGEEQYNMKVYGTSGSLVGDFGFTMDYSAVQLSGERIYINNAQECQIYTVKGVQKYNGTFQEDVRALVPSAQSVTRHVVVTDSGVMQMRLN